MEEKGNDIVFKDKPIWDVSYYEKDDKLINKE